MAPGLENVPNRPMKLSDFYYNYTGYLLKWFSGFYLGFFCLGGRGEVDPKKLIWSHASQEKPFWLSRGPALGQKFQISRRKKWYFFSFKSYLDRTFYLKFEISALMRKLLAKLDKR